MGIDLHSFSCVCIVYFFLWGLLGGDWGRDLHPAWKYHMKGGRGDIELEDGRWGGGWLRLEGSMVYTIAW